MAGAITNPERYEAWYHTPRGCWIGDREFRLMMDLLQPMAGSTLLDAGCGTGHFSRRFASAGLQVTGLDSDSDTLDYARLQDVTSQYIMGSMLDLPFEDDAFDYCAAVTSLCFMADPEIALKELWRVSRHAVVLGVLNRHSLLYRQKRGRGGYLGARWDTRADIAAWAQGLTSPVCSATGTAIALPGGGGIARVVERLLPMCFPWGGFLAVVLAR